MTGTSSSRRFQVALAVIALGAFALRVFPFFGPDGPWSYRVDYDEGVYFSAASLLLQGALPWRDFVFVHPPGILVFLALTSAWTQSFLGVDGAFEVSRWIAAVLGTINVVLVARLAGPARWGALAAAAFYATYPEIVQVERGPFLEPLLNLVCLSMAVAVVNASEHRKRWLLAAGALAGLAVSIKIWAVLWVLGALWAVSTFAPRRDVLRFVGAAAAAFGLVVLPFALQAPVDFVTQVGLFHLWRPPDGLTDRLPRVEQLVALRHLASPLLALVMVGLLVARKGPAWTVATRVIGPAYVLTLSAFFASAAYWTQYNAHLIASEAVLAGSLLGWLLSKPTTPLIEGGGRSPPVRTEPSRGATSAENSGAPSTSLGVSGPASTVSLAVAGLVVVSLGISGFHAVRRSASDGQHLALARSPLRSSPDCVFTFEPGWSLAAGRLPPRTLVDNYATQLLGAGHPFPSAAAAFASVPQPLPALEQCRSLVLGERGHRQLSPEALAKLRQTHAPLELDGLEVWQRH